MSSCWASTLWSPEPLRGNSDQDYLPSSEDVYDTPSISTNTGWWFEPLWKNISQLGWFFYISGKITNVPNHQPIYGRKSMWCRDHPPAGRPNRECSKSGPLHVHAGSAWTWWLRKWSETFLASMESAAKSDPQTALGAGRWENHGRVGVRWGSRNNGSRFKKKQR